MSKILGMIQQKRSQELKPIFYLKIVRTFCIACCCSCTLSKLNLEVIRITSMSQKPSLYEAQCLYQNEHQAKVAFRERNVLFNNKEITSFCYNLFRSIKKIEMLQICVVSKKDVISFLAESMDEHLTQTPEKFLI